jgi:hypothetical protein
MSLNADAQILADKYSMAVKEIRLIGKDGKLSDVIQPGYAPKSLLTMDFTRMPLNKDFSTFTEEYRSIIQEVRIIYLNGCGASQFFPAGTPEKIVMNAVIPEEELKP